MKLRWIAVAALVAVALAGAEGLMEQSGQGGVLTGGAAASCIDDGVTGQCHHVCVPHVDPLPRWGCPL